MVKPELLERTNRWSPETREVIAEYVETNAPALAEAEVATQFYRFRFPADFSYGPDTQLPHLGQIRTLAHAIALKAALSIENNQASDWPEQVLLLLKLSSTLDDEPDLQSHLLRNSVIRTAVAVTELGFSQTNPDDNSCRHLEAAFAQAAATNSLPGALIGERAIMIPVFRLSWSEIQNASQNEDTTGQPRKPQRYSGKPTFFLWLSGMFERDLNFYLQVMDKGITTASLPAPTNLSLTNDLNEEMHVAQKRAYFLTEMYLPSLSSVIRREASTRASIELAQLAAAAAQYHNVHGTWPDDLKQLIPQFLHAVPIDPIDGQPLRYRLTTNGYVVYSVGLDGHDDGGKERPNHPKSNDTNTYDITFVVER
jgi:hypothetical protein